MQAAGRVGVALLLALPPVLLAAPSATAAEPCVGIVIDARLLGGEVTTACAKGDPDSGLQAMTRAGISYRFLPRQPGLVCQIGGSPDCARTTGTTYWSYWHRAKGSTRWTYSTVGAASHDPAPGSTEGWVWQDGGRRQPPDIALRAICPDAFAAPSVTKAPTSSALSSASASSLPTHAKTAARTSTSPGPDTSAPTPGTARSTTQPPTSTTETPSPADAGPTQSATTRPAQASQGGADTEARGSWTGVATASALVALFGGAAVARFRRPGGKP